MRSLRVERGILLLVVLTGACGSSESDAAADAVLPDSATGASGASGTGGRDAGGSSGSGGSGFDPIDTACLSDPQPTCLSCCYAHHSPDGNPSLAQAIIATRTCACETPGTCRSLCSTTYCI